MITHWYPSLRENAFIRAINRFLYSGWYFFAVAALMAMSNLFSLEIVTYWLFLLFAGFSILFADDLFPCIPLACCGYMTFSKQNNPAANVGGTAFSRPEIFGQFVAIIAVIAVLILARIAFEIFVRRNRQKLPALTAGFALLGAAYLLGGAFSPYYEGKTILFGAIQIAALSGFYFLFYYTVNWSRYRLADFALLFTAIGAGMVAETIGMYLTPDVLEAYQNGTFQRGLLNTGWGVYNNVGCIMAMCLPAPFCLAALKKNGWAYNLVGNVYFLALVLTQSRNSILSGIVLYLVCAVLVVVKTKGAERKGNLIVYGAALIALAICAIAMFQKVGDLFDSLVNIGFDDNGRWEIYENGMKQFFAFPVFGNGFYQCTAWQFGNLPEGSFLPPRYHDTYVQLLASGGVIAFAAYCFHRVQTIRLVLKKPDTGRLFLGLCVLALILTSIVDCNFFNFGPGLLYACLLAAIERVGGETPQEAPSLPQTAA